MAITVFRFVFSVLAPLKRIFATPVPADGEAACLVEILRRTVGAAESL